MTQFDMMQSAISDSSADISVMLELTNVMLVIPILHFIWLAFLSISYMIQPISSDKCLNHRFSQETRNESGDAYLIHVDTDNPSRRPNLIGRAENIKTSSAS